MSALMRLPDRVDFLGLRFDRLDQDATLQVVTQAAGQDRFTYVVTPNVDHVVGLSRAEAGDSVTRAAYEGADLVLCDSRILQMLANFSDIGLPLVTGSDLTIRLLGAINQPGTIVAVIGGDADLIEALARLYPGIDWRHHMPPMGVRRDPLARLAIAEFVESAGAHYVLLAIGAPQSEIVCAEIAARGRVKGVALCIGASLEFVTGVKRRAPAAMQALRLEWLFRLLSEPRRLWRRYLVEGPKIVSIWLRWRASRSRPHARSGSSHAGRS
jgi:exopolysaccharide biosynthesis WecB/TagA/CpsF family protein